MRFLEMGAAFTSVGFVLANLALSLLTMLIWRIVRPKAPSAGSLFLLRMTPTIGSAALVLGLLLPAYWAFEPRSNSERAGALLGFVLVAALLLAAGMRRLLVSWRDTRRLVQAWMAAAQEDAALGFPVDAYRVPSDRPFAALVGIVRPRLFVSGRFLDVLSPSERRAVLSHEAGHLRSLDNLKRAAMKLAPDWLSWMSTGRQIESAWAMAAEEEADDHAAGPGGLPSLELAGALLKASRLMPLDCGPVSSFCQGSTVARRVERLLADSPDDRAPARSRGWRIVWVTAALGVALLLVGPALPVAYELTEDVVRLLR